MQSQDSASGAASSSAASIELSPRSVVVHPGGARPRNSTTQIDDAVFNRKLKHMGKSGCILINIKLYVLLYNLSASDNSSRY